jgi:hypothetical protein
MPRLHSVNRTTDLELGRLLKVESEYQSVLASNKQALSLSIEYVFLSAYKVWENFLEDIFASYCRFNDPVKGKRISPFLSPKSEAHAREIIKLEKAFVDWTSPDNVVQRAEILFKRHQIITVPLKSSMTDLRDAKKIRNFIAHGSAESLRVFKDLALNRTGRNFTRAGDFLLTFPSSSSDHYAVYYIKIFRKLVSHISQ